MQQFITSATETYPLNIWCSERGAYLKQFTLSPKEITKNQFSHIIFYPHWLIQRH